jgi:hypothetical protein
VNRKGTLAVRAAANRCTARIPCWFARSAARCPRVRVEPLKSWSQRRTSPKCRRAPRGCCLTCLGTGPPTDMPAEDLRRQAISGRFRGVVAPQDGMERPSTHRRSSRGTLAARTCVPGLERTTRSGTHLSRLMISQND